MTTNNQLLPKNKGTTKTLIWIGFLLIILYTSAVLTDVGIGRLLTNLHQAGAILQEMLRPDWAYLPVVLPSLLETIQMAILGTAFGALFAFPFSLYVARNMESNTILSSIARFILNIIRTIPELLLAAIFVAIFGIGPLPGVFALAVFSFGMVTKLFFESVETIDPGPIEALKASGANRLEIMRFAVIPQVMSYFWSYVLFAFEINIRASTVLGYIGAGGIGIFLQRALSQVRYDRVAVIVLVIFAVVLIIDYVSNKVREKLL
jgi:phosphonate transport system permease protein